MQRTSTAPSPADLERRLGQRIGMSGSDHDGEALDAVRAANALLREHRLVMGRCHLVATAAGRVAMEPSPTLTFFGAGRCGGRPLNSSAPPTCACSPSATATLSCPSQAMAASPAKSSWSGSRPALPNSWRAGCGHEQETAATQALLQQRNSGLDLVTADAARIPRGDVGTGRLCQRGRRQLSPDHRNPG